MQPPEPRHDFLPDHSALRSPAETELALKNALLRAIAENVIDPVYVKDRAGRIVFVNAATLHAIGLPESSVLGRRESEWLGATGTDSEATVIETNDRRVLAGETLRVEESYRGRIYESAKAPVRDATGAIVGVVGVSRDVTERKELEKALAVEMERTREANAAKDRLLAILSHELRTPLTPIFLIATQNRNDPEATEESRADWDMVHRNINLQVRLIDDLLDVSRIERGELHFRSEPVDVPSLLAETVRMIGSEARRSKLQMVTEFHLPQAVVLGDDGRLRQVFWNLLRNAIKFTPEGGRIGVSAYATSHEGADAVQVEVADSGIGMTEEELACVFKPFAQGDHARDKGGSRYGGVGLGLAIAREIVQRHGGRIWAESSGRGRGARLYVTLPLRSPGADPVVEGPAGRG